jgi:hypothetical protein
MGTLHEQTCIAKRDSGGWFCPAHLCQQGHDRDAAVNTVINVFGLFFD